MGLTKTVIAGTTTGVVTLAIFSLMVRMRAPSYFVNELLYMFNKGAEVSFPWPPFNGTLHSCLQFFHMLQLTEITCSKTWFLPGRSCKKLSTTDKELCLSKANQFKSPCVSYSFGLEDDLEFETALLEAFGCTTHLFDHRVTGNISREGPTSSETYHPIGNLAGGIDENLLRVILRNLAQKHSHINILKMDLWGLEWQILKIILEEKILDVVDQLTFSSHLEELKHTPLEQWRDKLQYIQDLLSSIFLSGLQKVSYREARGNMVSLLVPGEDIPRPSCGRLHYIRS